MKSVLICVGLLALSQCGCAVKVCNDELSYSSTLERPPCDGNNALVRWPKYNDFSVYYKCVNTTKYVVISCPPNEFFNYYFQECVECDLFMPAPSCDALKKTVQVTCVNNTNSSATTTYAPPVTKTTTTQLSTASTTPDAKRPTIPTPSTPTSGIPTPPIVVTPGPGIPTPPSEPVTPPTIPATPPMLFQDNSE